MSKKFLVIAAVLLTVAFSVSLPAASVIAMDALPGHPKAETPPPLSRAQQLKALEEKVERLKKQVEEIRAPFFEEFKLLNADQSIVFQPYKERIEAIDAEKQKALAAVDQEQRDLIRRRLIALNAVRAESDEVYARLEKATVDQNTQWKQLQDKLAEFKSKGVAADDDEVKAALKRLEELKAEYAEIAKPFEAELDAIEQKLEAVRAAFRPERDALWAKPREVSAPFDKKMQEVRDEFKDSPAGRVLTEWAKDINMREDVALGNLPQELSDAEGDLFFLRVRRW